MQRYNFDFNDPSYFIKIYVDRLSFNKPLLTALGNPDKINIGIDKTGKALCVKVEDKKTDAKAYTVSGGQVFNRRLVKVIKSLCDKKLLDVDYDNDTRLFVAKLND